MAPSIRLWSGIIIALVVGVVALATLFPDASFLSARIDPNDARDIYAYCAYHAQQARDECRRHAADFFNDCLESQSSSDDIFGGVYCVRQYRDMNDHCDCAYDAEIDGCHEEVYGSDAGRTLYFADDC